VDSTQDYGDRPEFETRVDSVEGRADAVPFERGEVLGRYVVLETLGQGGMGVVLAAFDSTLDRRVALKLLRRHASSDPEHHARLLREAQALAKLSHPAVVSVYDVGELRGQVFIAMEYIDGPNLRQWGREAERSPGKILSVFRNAAKGLLAAHDAGVVHRDFKPDNVLIGSDGGVRVTDFGLALEAHVAAEPLSSGWESTSGSSRLTQTGMVMGTPAYMPVEQHIGHPTDHRSDQYSFCVALFEALYGIRPFSGTTGEEYCAAIREGALPAPVRAVSVSRRVHRAIVAGLSAEPEDRHPSMRELIRALTPRARSRRTWIVAGLGGVGLGATVVTLSDTPARPCAAFDERIAETFDDADRAGIRTAFEGTGLAFARGAHARVIASLDQYAERWAVAARDACMASERGEQSDHTLDLRMHCLERARSRFAASVDVLRTADAAVVREAVGFAASQAELSLCEDLELLERSPVVPTDADEAAESDALLGAIDRIEALHGVGRRADAKALYAEYQARFDASTYVPLRARALVTRGHLLGADDRADEAIPIYEQAHLLALEYGLDGLAARSARSLSYLYYQFKSDARRTEHFMDVAVALSEASGSIEVQASVQGVLAELRARQARFDEAVAAATRQVELAAAAEHANHATSASAKLSLAKVTRYRDGPKAAAGLVEGARAYASEHLGPDHPALIRIHAELSAVAQLLGDDDEGYAHQKAALELARAVYEENSLGVAFELVNLGSVVSSLGRTDEALEYYAEADAVFVRDLGRDHPDRVGILNNMASIWLETDLARAETAFLEAFRVAKQHEERSGSMLIVLGRNLGIVHMRRGTFAEARAFALGALERSAALYGNDHMQTAMVHAILGRIARAAGDYVESRSQLENAVAVGHDSPTRSADFDFYLGRSLVEDPAASADERARGMRLVRKAERVLSSNGPGDTVHAKIVAWLAEHQAEHQEGFSPG
jgi:tetratricopeptide (TPR) repeat protein/predicted Ser/Thr protein kinase